MVDQLGLEDRKEALHGRIIVHVAGTTHAGQGLGIGQELLIVAAGILAAAVGVMQQASSCDASAKRPTTRVTVWLFPSNTAVSEPQYRFAHTAAQTQPLVP